MGRMWFDANGNRLQWSEAAEHLSRVDPVMRKVIRSVGPCQMKPRRDYFVALCRAIFAQQLNVRVAQVLFDRFRDLLPGRRLTPKAVIDILEKAESIRGCGLSRQKAGYLRDLAEHFADGRIPNRRLSRMSDEEIIQALTAVKGIGQWTAEMFLMFVLNRPDVLPVDDLGVREGVRDLYGLGSGPSRQNCSSWPSTGGPIAASEPGTSGGGIRRPLRRLRTRPDRQRAQVIAPPPGAARRPLRGSREPVVVNQNAQIPRRAARKRILPQ